MTGNAQVFAHLDGRGIDKGYPRTLALERIEPRRQSDGSPGYPFDTVRIREEAGKLAVQVSADMVKKAEKVPGARCQVCAKTRETTPPSCSWMVRCHSGSQPLFDPGAHRG